MHLSLLTSRLDQIKLKSQSYIKIARSTSNPGLPDTDWYTGALQQFQQAPVCSLALASSYTEGIHCTAGCLKAEGGSHLGETLPLQWWEGRDGTVGVVGRAGPQRVQSRCLTISLETCSAEADT
jgi:hypothetical protein